MALENKNTLRYRKNNMGQLSLCTIRLSTNEKHIKRYLVLLEVDGVGDVRWDPAVDGGVALRVDVGMSYSTMWIPCAL